MRNACAGHIADDPPEEEGLPSAGLDNLRHVVIRVEAGEDHRTETEEETARQAPLARPGVLMMKGCLGHRSWSEEDFAAQRKRAA